MAEDTRITDFEDVKKLKARYFRYVDTKQWDRLHSLYTDDARFDGFAFQTDTVAEFVTGVSGYLTGVQSVHHGFMAELEPTSPDTIRGIWAMDDYLVWKPGSRGYKGISLPGQWGIHGYGHYEDEYRRTPDGWRISFQRLTRLRVDPLAGGTGSTVPDYGFAQLTPGWLD